MSIQRKGREEEEEGDDGWKRRRRRDVSGKKSIDHRIRPTFLSESGILIPTDLDLKDGERSSSCGLGRENNRERRRRRLAWKKPELEARAEGEREVKATSCRIFPVGQNRLQLMHIMILLTCVL